MEVVLEIVGNAGAAVAVVHAEKGEVRVALQVAEGGTPVLVRLLVPLNNEIRYYEIDLIIPIITNNTKNNRITA